MCIPHRVLDILIIIYEAHRFMISTGCMFEEREM